LRNREHRPRSFERIQSETRRLVLAAQVGNAQHSRECAKSPQGCRREFRVRRKVCALLRIITIGEEGRARETMVGDERKCHV
jgi:hypothetical protein